MLRNKQRDGIHVTDITKCLRASYYDKNEATPEWVHMMSYRTFGLALHGYLEGSDEYLHSELPLKALGLVGTADVVYRDGRIIDFKTARWISPSRLPYASHELQVNIYAEMIREMIKSKSGGEWLGIAEPTSAAIQYIDLSGPTRCRLCKAPFLPGADGTLRCPKCLTTNKEAHSGNVLLEVFLLESEEIRKIIEERRDVLSTSVEKRLPPPREEGLCNYCSHQEICFNESETI
jgi:CRISPR/Cas system-associated exonuclease Cas4 (RecB family)